MRRLALINGEMHPSTYGEYCGADDAVEHIEELEAALRAYCSDPVVQFSTEQVRHYKRMFRELLNRDKGGE